MMNERKVRELVARVKELICEIEGTPAAGPYVREEEAARLMGVNARVFACMRPALHPVRHETLGTVYTREELLQYAGDGAPEPATEETNHTLKNSFLRKYYNLSRGRQIPLGGRKGSGNILPVDEVWREAMKLENSALIGGLCDWSDKAFYAAKADERFMSRSSLMAYAFFLSDGGKNVPWARMFLDTLSAGEAELAETYGSGYATAVTTVRKELREAYGTLYLKDCLHHNYLMQLWRMYDSGSYDGTEIRHIRRPFMWPHEEK